MSMLNGLDFTKLMLGVPLDRDVTEADVKKAYPRMPLNQKLIWQQIREAQEAEKARKEKAQ